MQHRRNWRDIDNDLQPIKRTPNHDVKMNFNQTYSGGQYDDRAAYDSYFRLIFKKSSGHHSEVTSTYHIKRSLSSNIPLSASSFKSQFGKYSESFAPERSSFQRYSGLQSHGRSQQINSTISDPFREFDLKLFPHLRSSTHEDGFGGHHSRNTSSSQSPGLHGAPPIQYSSLSGPSFVSGSEQNLTVVAGTSALLTCTIRNLHNHTVSF